MAQAYCFLLFYTSEILFPVFEACFEEIREAANVFVVRIRAREGLSVVVKQHVEGLRVRAEQGPLKSPATNQRLYRQSADGTFEDITRRFWQPA